MMVRLIEFKFKKEDMEDICFNSMMVRLIEHFDEDLSVLKQVSIP